MKIGSRPLPSPPLPPPGGHMGTHGMLVFGDSYLSHIPMFHEPHDYQIIMDVELKHPQLAAGTNFGQELHTFVPDKFSLGDLLNGELKQIEGTLYRGNFEKDGQPLLEDVQAEIKDILRTQKLDQGSQGSTELEYVLYGTHQDAYLIHPIHGNAGFDQLLSVEASVQATDEELKNGILVKLPGRPNDVQSRLQPKSGAVSGVEAESGEAVKLKVKKELSVLVGPHFMEGPGSDSHHHSHH